ncbi:Isoflavone reductase PCBER1-like protein [Lachnellula hyalina]|uniref:Isoflavone reductase PCBER1-like protein n=1 Tax=Lachnellula hyalina TaxID=1316788 RepID=A0A8H8R302_9HELO|nr:Isoflavone reductase PCBER1-like protein [Lachnellula hyalina]TVY27428.1 Isoflavone reductase PCBER1-like protein [Lachnellula hyalina]
MTSILVLGAGELGSPMLTFLAAKIRPSTATLTVLLRPQTISNPSRAAELDAFRALDISFLPGDIAASSISKLVALFKPYDLIVSCLGFASGPGSQAKICTAVLEAGVSRFVPWQFGVDYDIIGRGSAQTLFDEQLDVRDLLRAQDKTEWVIISTGMFTSFLFESSFGVVDLSAGHAIVRGLGGWKNKVTVTTPGDIGKLTAEILFTEPRLRNQVVYTAGETISYGELADLVESVTSRKVHREEWSVEAMKARLKEDPDDVLQKYRVVFAEGKGVSWDMEQTFNAQKQIETEGVRSWALQNIVEV